MSCFGDNSHSQRYLQFIFCTVESLSAFQTFNCKFDPECVSNFVYVYGMDRNQLLSEEDYEPHMSYPSYRSSDSNFNVKGHTNGSYTNSGLRRQSSLIGNSRKSFDLSSTFERSEVILGWEDIDVFVHKQTGFFDRCLKRGRGNIEFVVNQIINGGIHASYIIFNSR